MENQIQKALKASRDQLEHCRRFAQGIHGGAVIIAISEIDKALVAFEEITRAVESLDGVDFYRDPSEADYYAKQLTQKWLAP